MGNSVLKSARRAVSGRIPAGIRTRFGSKARARRLEKKAARDSLQLSKPESPKPEPQKTGVAALVVDDELILPISSASEPEQTEAAPVVTGDQSSKPDPGALEPRQAEGALVVDGQPVSLPNFVESRHLPCFLEHRKGEVSPGDADDELSVFSPSPLEETPPTSPTEEPLSSQTTHGGLSSVDSGLGTVRSGSLASVPEPDKGRRTWGSTSQARHTEADPDAITTAPLAGSKPAPAKFGAQTSRDKGPLESCGICGVRIGMTGSFQGSIERTAYLPCGHAFGHECLFNWIVNIRDQGQKCPLGNCTTLRHYCEHTTAPMKTAPLLTYANNQAAVIPWNYEFCETPKGKELHFLIREAATNLRKAETGLKTRVDTAAEFGYQTLVKLRMHQLKTAEKKLDKQQKLWWQNQWKNFWEDMSDEKGATTAAAKP